MMSMGGRFSGPSAWPSVVFTVVGRQDSCRLLFPAFVVDNEKEKIAAVGQPFCRQIFPPFSPHMPD